MKSKVALAVLAGLASTVVSAQSKPPLARDIVVNNGVRTAYLADHQTLAITHSKHRQYPLIELGVNEQRRYIVELQNPSLLAYRHSLLQAASDENGLTQQTSQDKSAVKGAVRDYFYQLKAEQDNVWQSMQQVAPKVALDKAFQRVSNALVVIANDNTIAAIQKLPQVKRVVAESYYYKSLAESVPLVGAPDVWAMTDSNEQSLQGDGITVAIIDTGIDYTHPALGGCFGAECKVTDGYDFHYGDSDPMDGDGHGTHVAAIVAANSDTMLGVAPQAKLHAYKALSDQGFGSDVNIIAAIERAVDPDGDPQTDDQVDVINMSLGGGGDATDPLSQATDAAVDAGIVVVVAAGNGGSYGDVGSTSPASARNAITVASSTKSDELSYFSSKGEMLASGVLKPEITAPGSDILSALPDSATGSLSGTSMAAPHVAGAAALLKQAFPDMSARDIKSKLMAGTVDLGEDPFAQGTGRMNIPAAIAATLVVPQGILSFGKVDNQATRWTNTASLLVENLSDDAVDISLALPDALPDGITLTINEVELTLEANSAMSLDFTIEIADVAALPTPENGAMVLFDNLQIISSEQTLQVPVVLEKSFEVALSQDTDKSIFVSLVNNAEGFYRFIDLPAGQSKAVKVPAIPLNITAGFGFFDDPQLRDDAGLPESAQLNGYIATALDVVEDTELSLSSADLTQFFGYQAILDSDGETVPVSGNGSTASFGVYLDGSSSGTWAWGFSHPVLAVNALTDSASTYYTFTTEDQSADGPEEMDIYVISISGDAGQAESEIVSLDLANDEHFTINVDPTLVPEEIGFNRMTYDPDGSGLGAGDNYTARRFNYYKTTDTFSGGMVELAVSGFVSENEIEAWFSTDRLATGANGQIVKYIPYTDQLVEVGDASTLIGRGGTYFTADISAQSSEMYWYSSSTSFDRAFINDTQLNNYDNAANATYYWQCDGEVTEAVTLKASSFDPHIVPELNCEQAQLIIEFDNTLFGETYRSSLTHSLQDTVDFYVTNLKLVSLLQNDTRIFDQAVNKLNPAVEVYIADFLAESVAVELKLGDNDWVTLQTSVNQANPQYVTATLPMFRGEEIGSLRISYGYDEFITKQELNGFMLIGADANGGNDVDDDGIENDLDDDHDNDGATNDIDAFPFDPTEDTDTDGDGIGNNADEDDDNDGVNDDEDAFPLDPTETVDTDGDGIGNNADEDDDNDGVNDTQDAFPLDPSESTDTDADGIGNNADEDDDNDGVNDDEDAFPLDPTESVDTDGDGIGNNADNDDDNDGVVDANDAYPLDPNRSAVPQPTPVSSDSGGGTTTSSGLLALLLLLWHRKRFARGTK
ncbi:S8 family peptidase [Alteromonas flava]|uniref:S8 family peptidase n=1 Tax=Alteromonas flava TaxID=2048003 RepID=UPI000C28A5A0|nr:S8 family serine peptidase [Alteromonas flava]